MIRDSSIPYLGTGVRVGARRVRRRLDLADEAAEAEVNCIKIGLPGKSILGDYFQENRTSRRPFLLLRINFPGRPIFIQLVPEVGVSVLVRRVRLGVLVLRGRGGVAARAGLLLLSGRRV